MSTIDRRNVLKTLGVSTLGFSLTRMALADVEPVSTTVGLQPWLRHLNTNAADLSSGAASPLEWQETMDRVYASTPLAQLKDHLQFERLKRQIIAKMPDDRGEFFQTIELSSPEELITGGSAEPAKRLITKVAHIRKGRAIPPHGHSNMASAFLCLSGEFEVWMYDRLEWDEEHMVVRQTRHDQRAAAGTWSSISDYRDNVHWLVAKTDDCYLFTVKMIGVEPLRPLKGRINIDLRRARQLGRDTYLAPTISHQQAREIY